MTDKEILEAINKIADADYTTIDEIPERVLLQIKVTLLYLVDRLGAGQGISP